MTTKTWEAVLCDAGLDMGAGLSPRVEYLPPDVIDAALAMEGSQYPDLQDIIQYKCDHMEAA